MNRELIHEGYRDIQAEFGRMLESVGGEALHREKWDRPGGGGGDSWTIAGEGPVERAAVNVSAVWGEVPASLAAELGGGSDFYATGVSIIVHPRAPHAPTFHANLRYFETEERAWFGGGADLTPYYLFDEDAIHFHATLRDVCGRHDCGDYPSWKAACDSYFHLPHRDEARGVGGIFFDRLGDDPESVWALQCDLGAAIVTAYEPILRRRIGTPHGPEHRTWHELRRGRYVEFNLVWDRGTRFGLETGGRTASILASLPPRARWDESYLPAPDSPESQVLDLLGGQPRDWLAPDSPRRRGEDD